MKQTIIEVLCDLCYDQGEKRVPDDGIVETTPPLTLDGKTYRSLDLCPADREKLDNLATLLASVGTPVAQKITAPTAVVRRNDAPRGTRPHRESAKVDCPWGDWSGQARGVVPHIYNAHGDGTRPDWRTCPDCNYTAPNWPKLAIHRSRSTWDHRPFDPMAEAVAWVGRNDK